jgi:hypothetical protein
MMHGQKNIKLWPEDSSLEPKHVAKFTKLITDTGCVVC